jgi:hypothetical protein
MRLLKPLPACRPWVSRYAEARPGAAAVIAAKFGGGSMGTPVPRGARIGLINALSPRRAAQERSAGLRHVSSSTMEQSRNRVTEVQRRNSFQLGVLALSVPSSLTGTDSAPPAWPLEPPREAVHDDHASRIVAVQHCEQWRGRAEPEGKSHHMDEDARPRQPLPLCSENYGSELRRRQAWTASRSSMWD